MVYLLLADGFEEIEALAPVDVLRRAGVEIKTVGVTGKTVYGAHGIAVEADMLPAQASESMDMLILPGGMPGTDNLDASPDVAILLDRALSSGAYIAAICAAPKILGQRGLLAGKRAVCYPGYEELLTGADICHDSVVTDGRFITARGAGVALDFAFELTSLLTSPEKAASIRSAMIARA